MARSVVAKSQWWLAAATASLVVCGASLLWVMSPANDEPKPASDVLAPADTLPATAPELADVSSGLSKPAKPLPTPAKPGGSSPKPAGRVQIATVARRSKAPLADPAKILATPVSRPALPASSPAIAGPTPAVEPDQRVVAQTVATSAIPGEPAPVMSASSFAMRPPAMPFVPPTSPITPLLSPFAPPASGSGANAASMPAPIQPLVQASTGDLPPGITVNRDGTVFVGFQSIKPSLDNSLQFPAVATGPRRYIYGKHVYVVSQDLLHGGSPVVDQWQNYTMSDYDDGPTSTDGTLPAGGVMIVRNEGTVAGVTDMPLQSSDTTWVPGQGSAHLVPAATAQAIATAYQTIASDPSRFIPPPMDSLPPPGLAGFGWHGGFQATTAQCSVPYRHYYHRFYNGTNYTSVYSPLGYNSSVGYNGYSYPQACLALVSEDARLTAVTLDYRGHSTPIEVVGDLEGARDALAKQPLDGDDALVQKALLNVYDTELALWQAVVVSNSSADAAQKAFDAGDWQQCVALNRQYQGQVALYRQGPQYDLFAHDDQTIRNLAQHAADALQAKPSSGGK
jgi:hypothetical protein